MRSLGLNPNEEDLHDIVAEIDVDNSGTIEFNGKRKQYTSYKRASH